MAAGWHISNRASGIPVCCASHHLCFLRSISPPIPLILSHPHCFASDPLLPSLCTSLPLCLSVVEVLSDFVERFRRDLASYEREQERQKKEQAEAARKEKEEKERKEREERARAAAAAAAAAAASVSAAGAGSRDSDGEDGSAGGSTVGRGMVLRIESTTASEATDKTGVAARLAAALQRRKVETEWSDSDESDED